MVWKPDSWMENNGPHWSLRGENGDRFCGLASKTNHSLSQPLTRDLPLAWLFFFESGHQLSRYNNQCDCGLFLCFAIALQLVIYITIFNHSPQGQQNSNYLSLVRRCAKASTIDQNSGLTSFDLPILFRPTHDRPHPRKKVEC